MGINLNLVPLLHSLIQGLPERGTALTMGTQTLTSGSIDDFNAVLGKLGCSTLDDKADGSALLVALGMKRCETLDISDYEGAGHIFDLNEVHAPKHLCNRYDLVFTGGTPEHIFHAGHALGNAVQMTRTGGLVVQIGPTNNWIDHGFYQLSPTLMFDYFNANNLTPVYSALLLKERHERDAAWIVLPTLPGSAKKVQKHNTPIAHLHAARKTELSSWDHIPKQWMYRRKHDGEAQSEVYAICRGQRIEKGQTSTLPYKTLALEPERIMPGEGHAWHYPLKQNNTGNTGALHNPFESFALLSENGVDYQVTTASQDHISHQGTSLFYHSSSSLVFSTHDGSNPRTNGRRYHLHLPDMAKWPLGQIRRRWWLR